MGEVIDLAWDDRRIRQFVTNVGLITTDGPHGANVMSAEWTHNISWTPGLIMLNVRDWDATTANIRAKKEFGVNLAAEGHNIFASIAGRYSGKEMDKIGLLTELGAKFYNAKRIGVKMIEGSAMNAECRVIREEKMGDHVIFVGEILELSADESIKPLLYQDGKYWKIGDKIHKPDPAKLDEMFEVGKKYKKS